MVTCLLKFNCCGLDVHKTCIYACIGITDSNNRTEYKQARFSSFTKGLNELCDWIAKYNCKDVCMESTGKYWKHSIYFHQIISGVLPYFINPRIFRITKPLEISTSTLPFIFIIFPQNGQNVPL